jgi:hypothetical protein
VALKSTYHLIYILSAESQRSVSDYLLYTVVGRGILNGLTPYIDLFESKPPGMFLLAAVSLLVSGIEGFTVFLRILRRNQENVRRNLSQICLEKFCSEI